MKNRWWIYTYYLAVGYALGLVVVGIVISIIHTFSKKDGEDGISEKEIVIGSTLIYLIISVVYLDLGPPGGATHTVDYGFRGLVMMGVFGFVYGIQFIFTAFFTSKKKKQFQKKKK